MASIRCAPSECSCAKRGTDVEAERDAMGADEYHPISHDGSDIAATGGIGYTVVGALDTMLLMGLDGEYLRARDWIEKELTFDRNADFNTFEVRFFLTYRAA
jgi:endoplasmic reticulum Man9GlcNAc2 1,2-alpha-mannosidase